MEQAIKNIWIDAGAQLIAFKTPEKWITIIENLTSLNYMKVFYRHSIFALAAQKVKIVVIWLLFLCKMIRKALNLMSI